MSYDETEFKQIYPQPNLLRAEQIVRDIEFVPETGSHRPYIALNMISTVDGKATLYGRTGPMGTRADRELFHMLRTTCDALMVGTGTLEVERYDRPANRPELAAVRASRGLQPNPLCCSFSRQLKLPLKIALFQDPESKVIVYTESDLPAPKCPAQLHIERTDGHTIDFRAAMENLYLKHGVRSVLCEGGPQLNGLLFASDLVDEIFLTVSPLVTAQLESPTIVSGSQLLEPAKLRLISAYLADDFLFLRYRRNPAGEI